MKGAFPPEVIDMAIVATIRMLAKGQAVVWQGARMYGTRQGTCINGEIVGDVVDATFIWFERYSKADPYLGHWGETPVGVQLLKRKFV
jgi:hypothetical protein